MLVLSKQWLAIQMDLYSLARGPGGVYRSDDEGDSWIQTGLDDISVLSLAVKSSGHIFAGTPGVVVFNKVSHLNSESGIYRSTDNGKSWTQVYSTGYGTYSIVVNSSGHLFAGIDGRGIIRSTDNGNTWERINTGLIDSRVYSLAVLSNDYVFAGTFHGFIFRSMDNGDNWTRIDSLASPVWDFTTDKTDHIFAGTDSGIFRSTDNGNNWIQTNESLTKLWSLSANSAGHIFAGTIGNGVFRSTDKGNNWTQISAGLTDMTVWSITINSNGYVFAGTVSSGVFRSVELISQ